MTIKNFLSHSSEVTHNMHGGEGPIVSQTLFGPDDFSGAWDFAMRLTLPPASSIGLHQHGNDEEMYIVLSGKGEISLEDETYPATTGDMILNKPKGKHQFKNNSDKDVVLLVIQASLNSDSTQNQKSK